MDEETQGEIALKFVKAYFAKQGIKEDLRRQVGQMPEELGITKDDAWAFIHAILPEVLRKCLGAEGVKLEIEMRTS